MVAKLVEPLPVVRTAQGDFFVRIDFDRLSERFGIYASPLLGSATRIRISGLFGSIAETQTAWEAGFVCREHDAGATEIIAGLRRNRSAVFSS